MPRDAKRKPKRAIGTPRALRRDATELVMTGIARHQRGDLEGAEAIYRRVLAEDEGQPDALHFLGMIEHQRGRSDAALTLFARALERAPELPDIHNNRGNVLKLLGRLDEAEDAYREALSLRPDDFRAQNNLATVLRERGRLDDAERLLREVVAAQPGFYPAHQNLGTVLSEQRRYGEALEAFRDAIRLQPADGNSYRHLGALFYATDRVDDAAEIYARWLEVEPGNPEAKHLLAACKGEAARARAPDEYVRTAFDRFADTFDSTLARLQYRAPELVRGAVLTAVGAPAGALEVLDAGCGTGLCAPLLRPFASRLVGVDLSARMLERARARGGYDRLEEAELTAFLAAHPAAFDLVVSADTLVYFGALDAVARSAASSLRPGGHLVFTVERSDDAEAPSGFRIHPHGRYSHTERYLRRALGDAAFIIDALDAVEPRKEAGAWVRGWLVTARTPAPSAG